MQPFDVSTELQFREESVKRTLQEFFDDDDMAGLMDAALLLNTLWHQQTAIARWFAHEAAENLGEAWQTHRAR